MSYDSKSPKISSLVPDIAFIAKPKIEDSSFLEQLLGMQSLAQFYGTDQNNNQAGYGATLLDALNNRIMEPVVGLWQQGHSCFFKPYETITQGFQGFLNGPPNVVLTLLAALGIYGNIYLMATLSCLPAIISLIAGIVSLGQALFYKIKSSNQDIEIQSKASEYLLDAVTRFALIVPLAVLSILATPIDFIRFFTRSIATLVQLGSNKGVVADTVAEETDTKEVSGTYSTPGL